MFPAIAALGLPDIVTIPPILSASSTKVKFIPAGRVAGFATLPKVFSPTTDITMGVIFSPKHTCWAIAPLVTVKDSSGLTVTTPVIVVSEHVPTKGPPGLLLVVIV